MLRDIVASVLLDRAKTLCAFENTDDAFEHTGQMKLGNGFVHLYKLDESLRGHEIVVASSNNKAVENVSKELPLREQIAEDIEELGYFNVISDALSEDGNETWGLIASVLGNSKNKSQFINKAWWDDDVGLRKISSLYHRPGVISTSMMMAKRLSLKLLKSVILLKA